jgi:hypothetical protein
MIYIREFKCRQELQDFVQGILVGTKQVDPYVGVNIRGLTLVFTTPAVTVTFPDTVAWESAKLNAIVAYINDSVTGTNQKTAGIRSYGYGALERTAVIALVKDADVLASGTAMAVLGLLATTVGAAKILKTDFLSVELNNVSNMFFLTYDK